MEIFTDDLEQLKTECINTGRPIPKEPHVLQSNTVFVAKQSGLSDDVSLIKCYACYQKGNPDSEREEDREDWFSFVSINTGNVYTLKLIMGGKFDIVSWAKYEDYREIFDNIFEDNVNE